MTNKKSIDREPLLRWRGAIRGAALILATVGAVGCYSGTDGIPQLDVRPVPDAAPSEGGTDGPRADGGDARGDSASAETGDGGASEVTPDAAASDATDATASDAADAGDTAPDAATSDGDAATDSAPSPDTGAAG